MVKRLLKLSENHSFFLFGARGTGKSTLIDELHAKESDTLVFNLLLPEVLDGLLVDGGAFTRQILLPANQNKRIVVDEVQKLPKLLDQAHDLISKKKRIFILTGSSARRLKQAGVNLLAGRAYVYHLYPFSAHELGRAFDLTRALERGLLPEAYLSESDDDAREYLRAYVLTYVEKEIQLEQWVRKIEPFRKFLAVAAQMSGKILNIASIAREVGVDHSTVVSYFEILEDTLLGISLPAFHRSVRKSQRVAPKFYLFDTGVRRALDGTLRSELVPKTSAFGEAFEHLVLWEIIKLASYRRLDWKFFYARTKDDVEIDLIIERPGQTRALVEIKSKDRVTEADAKALETLGADLDPRALRVLLSQDSAAQKIGGTLALPWREGIEKLFRD